MQHAFKKIKIQLNIFKYLSYILKTHRLKRRKNKSITYLLFSDLTLSDKHGKLPAQILHFTYGNLSKD